MWYQYPAGHDRHVIAITQDGRPADRKWVCLLGDHRNRRAAKPQVHRPWVVGAGQCRFLRFNGIARDEHRHLGERAQDRQLFQRLGRRAVRPDRQTSVGAGDLDVELLVAHGKTELLDRLARDKLGKRAGKWDLAADCKAGGRADHVLLGDADGEKAAGVLLLEPDRARGILEVAGERHDVGMGLAQLEQSFAEPVARGLVRHQTAACNSFNARSNSSGFGATPCQAGLSSMNETPFPFTVRATMTWGLPLIVSASS